MTNPTPHGQVPEALIDLIDAYAETRHRCGGIYNAKTEAARKAVIEALSGVQALSAAPAWKQGSLVTMNQEPYPALGEWFVQFWEGDDVAARVYGNDRDTLSRRCAMLAASPTPPEEQQAAPKAAPGEPVASAAKGAIMGAAYDFRDAHISGSMNLKRSAHAALEAAVDNALAALQQEAQEPMAIKAMGYGGSTGINDYLMSDGTIKAMRPSEVVWAAPQPAPAPLSDDVVKDAARYQWLRENWFTMTSNYQRCITFKVGEPRWSDITEEELDAAIDAALAAQGDTP